MPSAAWGITRRRVWTERAATARRGEKRTTIARPREPEPWGEGEREGGGVRIEAKCVARRVRRTLAAAQVSGRVEFWVDWRGSEGGIARTMASRDANAPRSSRRGPWGRP